MRDAGYWAIALLAAVGAIALYRLIKQSTADDDGEDEGGGGDGG